MVHRLLELNGHTVVLTNPNRHIHGDEGPTKGQLLAYYMNVAARIIPFLRERPASVVLLPNESSQELRFVRTTPPGGSTRAATLCVPWVDRSLVERYLTVPDSGALAALVDHGCVSFHPWNSTAVASRQPTQMVFNLDPEAIAFREVRNAALLVRDLLAVCGLTAWVKTSGGQGLHVLVPVSGSLSFDDTRLVADTIVRRAMRREPKLFSRDPRRARRRGRILIDTSRNERGRTLIAPYAVATTGLVSALLEWDELQRPLYPEDFDIERVLPRESFDLKNQGAFFAAEQSLEPLIRRDRRRFGPPTGRRHVHNDTAWLSGDMPAALADEAHQLSAESQRLRAEAEVTRIESANVRYRAQKVQEERRRLDRTRRG